MKKILLTGATGFVGSALQQRIVTDQHCDLTIAVRRLLAVPDTIRAVQVADLTAETDWSDALQGIDVVIHAAARAHVLVENVVDPLIEFRKTNVEGALTLAHQALTAGVKRFVFISSIGVNGAGTELQPFTELDASAPHAPYAVSKLEAEVALKELCAGTTMELVIVRPSLVYAAHAPGNFARLLKLVSSGVPLPFALVKNQRSMVALDNLVDFILCCTTHPKAAHQTFLIADQESISTPQMLRCLSQGMGKRILLLPVPVSLMRFAAKLVGREALFNQLCGSLEVDSSKARNLLGWTPPVTVEDAMRKTAQAYLKK
ncbi:MAG: NAD-dependent epimerase/dehydratase family protein [Gammaproteobacteria bacterium]|nr:NAD-dependent epimerase/dehydratase family protein [Gammaproteobacteria bacterium]